MSESQARLASEHASLHTPLQPVMADPATPQVRWSRVYGNSAGLLLTQAAHQSQSLILVITPDSKTAQQLEIEARFYAAQSDLEIRLFPDWETLPYDLFSPHPDIISQRIESLIHLPAMRVGLLIVPVSTLLQRLPPQAYLDAHSLSLRIGESLQPDALRQRLEQAGYRCVSQVMEHGEFAVRGALIDLYPMGSDMPYRIDLFDEEIESLRRFDPETQRTLDSCEQVHLLPAREFPLNEADIKRFRRAYRQRFEGQAQRSVIYREVSEGRSPNGIEYYLPLFFEQVQSLFDYLPDRCLVTHLDQTVKAADEFWDYVGQRYESRRHDVERPLLPPEALYLSPDEMHDALAGKPRIEIQRFESITTISQDNQDSKVINYATAAPPVLHIQARSSQPYAALSNFVEHYPGRILLTAESTGRREVLLDILRQLKLHPRLFDSWQQFLQADHRLGMTVAPLDVGAQLLDPAISIIAESQLFGERAIQQRRRRGTERDADSIIRNLTDLHIGAPVVHEEHGVGRYLGLQKLNVGKVETEFLTLEYAEGAKLYVPVASLHLISRYSGGAPENAPLHRLGGDTWARLKKKATQKIHDVAVELLDIYARRAARKGVSHKLDEQDYAVFAGAFPFEETPDQQAAIDAVIEDMTRAQPMDRVICGDVGFGKTEVAMRATFVATQNNKQVAVLVPTTLLAQQHYQNFQDRFADWPVRVEVLSRFKSAKQQQVVLDELATGKIDIVIGTHKILQGTVKFRDLGLVIVDEEHRFGVRHKEKLKALRTQVDLLTLTATPIPRTLNMSLSGIRDLSIIATPPVERVAIKTFVSEWDDNLLIEAFQRELSRGGQIYFLHNEVSSIEKTTARLSKLIPHAQIRIAHGQMRERELEQVMLDFYHQRFNVLVCTTIIESGIDVPSANTIIINRADKLGLAQLHQIRGRVGRSHHRAYAYLLIPDKRSLTADAEKRLQAIESLEDLGAGFMLATHDLEIRGAGELLGEEQSGQMHEIGFTLYTELLERAVNALKSGQLPELDQPLDHGPEVDLHLPALLPEDYLPDVHSRLIMYKRIASAVDKDALQALQVEMIDRFGLLPESARHLFKLTEVKLLAQPLGIRKMDVGPSGGRILFNRQANINPLPLITRVQQEPDRYKLEGQEKLKLKLDLPTEQQRLDFVEELLHELQPQAD